MTIPERRPAYRGSIARTPTGEIRGVISCVLTGWQIDLELTRTTDGYDVIGFLGATPPSMLVPGIDEEIGARKK